MKPRNQRIGLIVPSSNTTMETELPAIFAARERLLPTERFTFHSARTRMKHVTPEELRAMSSATARAAAELADLRPDAVVSACLVAIMAQGAGHHNTVEHEIADALAAESAPAPVISSAGALVAALRHLGARRIGIVTPYVPTLTDLVVDYLGSEGIEVADAVSLGVADNRTVAALDPADLPAHASTLDLDSCDAVVASACVQMPSLPALDDVRRATGLPTLSAATATAWGVLRELGLLPVAPEAGDLLDPAATVRL